MSNSIDQALADCLESIETQGSSIEECTAAFPKHQDDLVDILELVVVLKSLDQITSRPQFREKARENLIAKLPDRNVTYSEKTRPIKPKRGFKLRLSFSVLQYVLVIALVLTVLTGGTALAADSSNPGDILYGLDLTIEQIQLDLAPDAMAAAKLRLNIAAERLEEAENRLQKGDVYNGNMALEAYEQEIAALENLVASQEGGVQEALADLVGDASSRNQEVLTILLTKVPDPAKAGIERALEASKKNEEKGPKDLPDGITHGPPEGVTTGPPEDKKTGKSEDKPKGKPEKNKTPPGKP